MKTRLAFATTAIFFAAAAAPASAQSFSCMETYTLNATEKRICRSRSLGNLDERLAFWYGRAMTRSKYFDQTSSVRSAQRSWIVSRNSCSARYWCIRRHYVRRIKELRNYAEHV